MQLAQDAQVISEQFLGSEAVSFLINDLPKNSQIQYSNL